MCGLRSYTNTIAISSGCTSNRGLVGEHQLVWVFRIRGLGAWVFQHLTFQRRLFDYELIHLIEIFSHVHLSWSDYSYLRSWSGCLIPKLIHRQSVGFTTTTLYSQHLAFCRAGNYLLLKFSRFNVQHQLGKIVRILFEHIHEIVFVHLEVENACHQWSTLYQKLLTTHNGVVNNTVYTHFFGSVIDVQRLFGVLHLLLVGVKHIGPVFQAVFTTF